MSEDQVAEAPVDAGQAPSEAVTAFNFRDHIDESIRDDPSLATYKDLNGMAKSLINAQKMIGADKISIPGAHSTDEEREQVYIKLGRPDDAAGYELQTNDIMQETDVEWLQDVALEIGLNKTQATTLLDKYTDLISSINETSQEDLQALSTQRFADLSKELGGDNVATEKLTAADEVVNQFAGESAEDVKDIVLQDGTVLGDHPLFCKMMINTADFLAEKLGEDKFTGRDNEIGMNIQDIHDEISKRTAPGTPYWEKHHPDHNREIQRVLELRGMIE